MFDLFAITDIPGLPVVRFNLSNDIQQEITDFFKDQEAAFRLNGSHEIPFDGNYKPDLGEVLTISNFSDKYGFKSCIDDPMSVKEIPPNASSFSKIRALFTGYKEDGSQYTVLFQHFDKRRILSTRGFSLYHSSNTYKKVDGIGVTIDTNLTAVLKGSTLKFCSFHTVRQFLDLTDHYKEATEQDVIDFAALPNIHVQDVNSLVEMADSAVRRKIFLIRKNKILDKFPVSVLKAAAIDLQLDFPTTNYNGAEVISLPSDKKDLKRVLKFLDEDFYISILSKTPHETNSKRPLK